jgi:hypothetical protein
MADQLKCGQSFNTTSDPAVTLAVRRASVRVSRSLAQS